ncbi:MAG: type II secretion system protein [Candidatus Omnitrophota bacterium]
MDRRGINLTRSAFTLIELLITISISTILGGAIVLMLGSSLDAYLYSEEQAIIHKVLDEVLEEISGEGFRTYGIKDALGIYEAKADVINFSCLWVDTTHRVSGKQQTLILNRSVKLGSPMPILELKAKEKDSFIPWAISFIPHQESTRGKKEDKIMLGESLGDGPESKIIFEADAMNQPDVLMKIKWDAQEARFVRTYANRIEVIPKEKFKGLKLTQARFQYYDNSNTELPVPVPEESLSSISAVKVTLELKPDRLGEKVRQASAFINLRNSRATGKGIIIRKGTRIKIPDSRHIKTLGVANVVGVKPGDIIQLITQPQQGKAWRVKLGLGVKDKVPILEKYSIEYPPGIAVYSETVNFSLDIPFNLLTIGKNGRFAYAFVKEGENVVDVQGDVFLVVEEMDPQGGALFIRP